MKKGYGRISATVVMLAAIVIVSCGGGGSNGSGGSGDTMTVTVVSQAGTTTKTYTHNGTDIITWGGVYHSPDITSVSMESPAVEVSVTANGATPGTYPITGESSILMVRYVLYTSPTTSEIYSTNGSGTIEMTAIGDVGQKITGSFNAEVYQTFPESNPTNTLNVSGTFSIKHSPAYL